MITTTIPSVTTPLGMAMAAPLTSEALGWQERLF